MSWSYSNEVFAKSIHVVRDPEPDPPDWDGSDNLGGARGLFTAVKLTVVVGLFIWGVVEFALHV